MTLCSVVVVFVAALTLAQASATADQRAKSMAADLWNEFSLEAQKKALDLAAQAKVLIEENKKVLASPIPPKKKQPKATPSVKDNNVVGTAAVSAAALASATVAEDPKRDPGAIQAPEAISNVETTRIRLPGEIKVKTTTNTEWKISDIRVRFKNEKIEDILSKDGSRTSGGQFKIQPHSVVFEAKVHNFVGLTEFPVRDGKLYFHIDCHEGSDTGYGKTEPWQTDLTGALASPDASLWNKSPTGLQISDNGDKDKDWLMNNFGAKLLDKAKAVLDDIRRKNPERGCGTITTKQHYFQ